MTNLGFIGIGRIACSVVKELCTSNIESATINLSPRNRENSAYLANLSRSVQEYETGLEH